MNISYSNEFFIQLYTCLPSATSTCFLILHQEADDVLAALSHAVRGPRRGPDVRRTPGNRQ
jgi:hypothetical protein